MYIFESWKKSSTWIRWNRATSISTAQGNKIVTRSKLIFIFLDKNSFDKKVKNTHHTDKTADVPLLVKSLKRSYSSHLLQLLIMTSPIKVFGSFQEK
jgi:hypothetical protein